MLDVSRTTSSTYLSNKIINYANNLKDEYWLQRAKLNYAGNGFYLGEVNSSGDRHGLGMYYYWDAKQIYFGDWYNDKKNGAGIILHDNNDIFYGEFRNGVMEGHGHYCHNNGQESEGTYANDRKIHTDYVQFEDGSLEKNDNNLSGCGPIIVVGIILLIIISQCT